MILARVDSVLAWVTWALAGVAVLLLLVGPRVVAHDSKKAAADSPYAGQPGAQLFKDNCGSCHTLSAAGTTGAVGPKLDGLGLTTAGVVAAMKAGPGAMPTFSLPPAQTDALAAFVAKASG